jgi:hypothetical protein
MPDNPGLIALLGSGETALTGGRIFETIAQHLQGRIHVALLETPAGFELNSKQVAWRVGEYLKHRLQNYDLIVDVVPARKRGTPFSPEDAEILQPLLKANIVFMGAGSPTYAVRELKGSLAWAIVQARHQLGAALVFTSAGTLAVSEFVLPVYEIYKVGEDVRVVQGLNLLNDFGISISFIPHWNNTDGGVEVDTSRCFIGKERFAQWYDLLPPDSSIVGLDEHTGLILDIEARNCTVIGIGSITRLSKRNPKKYPAGRVFALEELGKILAPESPEKGIPTGVLEMIRNASQYQCQVELPAEVGRLSKERQEARLRNDWNSADRLRNQLSMLGWTVQDTPLGQKIYRR